MTYAADVYLEQKLAQRCTYWRCTKEPADGAQLCPRHLSNQRKRDAKFKAKQRADRRQAGFCAFCPAKSLTYRCPKCRIEATPGLPLPPSSVQAGVDKELDPWRRDNDGWQRYRGKGRRGPPPAPVVDDEDLKAATESLERGRTSLAYANSEAVRALGRDHHKAARAAAASILGMASRMIEDVAVRNLPTDQNAVSLRGKVRAALGEGVEQDVIDDRMIDRVIAAVRDAEPMQARGRR